jgi:hypothetical protein
MDKKYKNGIKIIMRIIPGIGIFPYNFDLNYSGNDVKCQ